MLIAVTVWKVAGTFEEPEIKFGGDGRALEATVETNNAELVMRQDEENISEKAVLGSQKYIFRRGALKRTCGQNTLLCLPLVYPLADYVLVSYWKA